jgi:murein DD-endopeptidase MepM/ murein hydrolase activator NlpD
MITTHLEAPIPRRAAARRNRRVVAFVVAATLTSLTPAPHADAGPAPDRRSCATAGAATHTVAAGDSWFGIAAASGVTMTALLRSNGAKASAALHPGDVLCLPSGATPPAPPTPACASTHVVARGDSWFAISRAAGLSLNGLLQANGATADTVLRPGASVCLPPGAAPPVAPVPAARACVAKRTVLAGESWYVISRTTGVPIDALVAANEARRTSPIHPGQSLCLPEVGFGRDLPGVLLDATPVRGACRFANSWQATRDGGRLHVGVDLISPSGTPVIAAVSGTLTRQSTGGVRSGNAWWLTTSTGTYVFYAHLSSFASGLSVGSNVRAGDVIGYVGSTGNAVSPHLHFEIHPGGGAPVNPYSSIWMVGGCTYDRRYEQVPLS